MQPKCKTCGDTGEVTKTFIDDLSGGKYGDFAPCPDCQQPTAGEFTKEFRQHLERERKSMGFAIWTQAKEACDRLDRAEAINKDLLDVLEYALVSLAVISMPRQDNNVATDAELLKIMGDSFRAAIAKAKKVNKRDGPTLPP